MTPPRCRRSRLVRGGRWRRRRRRPRRCCAQGEAPPGLLQRTRAGRRRRLRRRAARTRRAQPPDPAPRRRPGLRSRRTLPRAGRANRPQLPDHAIAHEPDGGHRGGERRDRECCDACGAAELSLDVDGRPVRPASSPKTAHRPTSPMSRTGRVGSANTGGASRRWRPGPRQEPRRGGSNRSEDDRRQRELKASVDAGMGCKRRECGAEEEADTPEAVEARHDGPAERLLDEYALRVHRHVCEARRRAEDEQSDAQQRERGRQSGQDEAGAERGDRRRDERAEP